MYQVHPGRGQSFFVACNGWRKDFDTGHQTYTIPDGVSEDILAKLIIGHPLEAGSVVIVAGNPGVFQPYPYPYPPKPLPAAWGRGFDG